MKDQHTINLTINKDADITIAEKYSIDLVNLF